MNNNDRINLIHRISELEGLTDRERSALLGLLRESKAYGLVWEDKPEAVEERMQEELPVLQEVPERALISDSKDAPSHILIEGDNLEALTTLAYTHAGRIDVIYIDPPYNTGNKDFVYNDSFVDREDTYRHSKWLSFMSRRLKIAKQLLSDKGVIFISIDDNEAANLRNLCDAPELFSENNFLGEIVWETATDNNPTQISTVHEFVLCYAKNRNNLEKWSVTSDKAAIIKAKYEEIVNSGITDVKEIRRKLKAWIKENKKSNECDLSGVSHYDYVDEKGVFYPGNSANTKPGGYTFDIIHPTTGKVCNKPANGYRWPERTFWDAAERGDVLWGEDEKSIPKIKKRIETATELLKSCYYEDGRAATAALTDILGEKKFNNPKPLRLISKLINFSSSKTSTILDFFAGSGTTLHATMQLNAEDGGNRQCILVTNNENGICENVTYERNKRVIRGYTTPKGEQVAGLTGNTLRYYKTDFVDRSRSVQNMRRLVNLSTDMLCIKEDLYAEQPTFCGERTYKNIFRYFDNGQKQMLVIYREEAIDRLVELIYSMDVEDKIKIYVFSPSEDPWEDSFEDVSDKVELCALPAAIYNAYRRILPKKKDAAATPEEDAAATHKVENPVNGMLNFTDEEDEV